MKIIITGGNGQLGREIISCSPKEINLSYPDKLLLNLENPDHCKEIVRFEKPDWIINCGAYTNVENAEINREKVFKINYKAPDILSRELEKNGGKLLQISTDYIFDGRKINPYKINHKTNPQNVYGESKDLAEKAIKNNFSNNNKYLILRTSWVISPFGKNFLLSIINLLKEKKSIQVVDDQIGCMTSTKSLAKISWRLIKANQEYTSMNKNFPSTHHWCDEGIITWYELACAIRDMSEEIGLIKNPAYVKRIKTEDLKLKARRPKYSVLDCTKTEKLLHTKLINWRESLFEILLKLKSTYS